MYVTNLPARIVGAKKIEVATSACLTIGSEGLGTRMRAEGDFLILTDVNNPNKTEGYQVRSGEEFEFSGTVDVANIDTSESCYLYILTTDSI